MEDAFHSSPVPDPPDSFAHPYSKLEYISYMYSAPDAYLCREIRRLSSRCLSSGRRTTTPPSSSPSSTTITNQKLNTRKRKYSGELSTGMEDISSSKVIRLAATIHRQEVDRIVA